MKLKTVLSLFFLLGAWVSPVAAQDFLPSSFGNWTAVGPGTQLSAAQIEQVSGYDPSILREYGIISAERRDFARGLETATATVFRMVDPTAAFGAFTFFREPRMTPLALSGSAPYSAGTRDRALLVIGNLLFDVSSPQARPTDAELTAFISAVGSRADPRPFPLIGNFLPQDGLIPGSERYLLGPKALARVFSVGNLERTDWIGFDKSAEAIVARYRLRGQPEGREAVLLLATYPTQQIAAELYAAMDKWMTLNADPSQTNGRPIVFGTRSSALVALLSGTDSRELAANFLGQIHYSSEVTWNEPSQEFTDPTMATIVVGAFLGSVLIMLVALAAGLGFSGFRLLMKFLFPGKVFDRSAAVEILQLGLGSKPVRSVDFYE